MICPQTKQWLLQAELPRELAEAPADVSAHLRECSDCQRLVRQLQRLERDWREQPLPASAAPARDEFLRRQGDQPARPAEAPPARRFVSPRWVVAACLVLAIGATAWFMAGPRKAQADGDVIDQLIDWNLQLSEAPGSAERQELYAGRVDMLRADIDRLPHEDRALAETLVRNGEWLTGHNEPVETADRFTAVADQLVERMDRAAARSDARATARVAKQLMFVSTRGIDAKLERVKKPPSDAALERQLERIAAREAKRLEKLEKMQERLEKMHDAAPANSKKELRQILDRPKAKKNARKGVVG